MSLGGSWWRGTVVGALVLVAQVAFALPYALSGENNHTGPLLGMFAMFVGVPVSGVLLAGVAARFLGLPKPFVVALAGLAFSVVLAWLSVQLGVPHLPTTADPGVLTFGAVFALPGYTAAAVAVSSVGLLARGIVVGLAIAVTIYVPVEGYLSYVTVSVGKAERPLHSCADAYTVLHHPESFTCREVDDRWVFEHETSSVLVVAVHDNALVMFSGGETASLTEARLRTVSSDELAAAPLGRR